MRASATIQGIAIADGLLNFSTVKALRQRHYWIQVWTVNSAERANELAAWGVNGITTDSLAMMDAMSATGH